MTFRTRSPAPSPVGVRLDQLTKQVGRLADVIDLAIARIDTLLRIHGHDRHQADRLLDIRLTLRPPRP
ncbi:MAG TPA: hypothetical protein VFR67_06140 [Pilimelia sp.]|nr:hypothetical protein [Pilimelia sp.]